jgi:hypothetical protein
MSQRGEDRRRQRPEKLQERSVNWYGSNKLGNQSNWLTTSDQ